MNTEEIVKEALKLVEMKELPSDSTIYVPGEKIRRILYGIDISSAELLYAKENGYDCVIAHHPAGALDAWRVFLRHISQLESKGVPNDEARQIVEKKAHSFRIRSHATNYDALPSFARLLKMPFLNIHCPSDELGRRLIHDAIHQLTTDDKDVVLRDIQPYLEEHFMEFKQAQTRVEILKGIEDDLLGDWIFSHGALTNGGFEIADCYFQHGIDTVLYIHIALPDLVKIQGLKEGQLMITGHIVSDSVGINPFLDKLEEKGCEITPIGGLIR